MRKDPQKYQCLVEILGKLIGSNEFDKVIDIIGEFDTQSDWKSGDQQLALAENVQPILTLFRNVKLDQNVKENAFLDCVRLLGAAMTRNSNVKRLMTKKFNLLKFLIEKMAELRHGGIYLTDRRRFSS